jgi:hypothetical protein
MGIDQEPGIDQHLLLLPLDRPRGGADLGRALGECRKAVPEPWERRSMATAFWPVPSSRPRPISSGVAPTRFSTRRFCEPA